MSAHASCLFPSKTLALTSMAGLALLLAACGGGAPGGDAASGAAAPAQAQTATGTTVFTSSPETLAALSAQAELQPTYHLAATLPPVPSQLDAGGASASALVPPISSPIPETLRGAQTRMLTVDSMLIPQPRAAAALAGGAPLATAAATASKTVTYTPAQIRAAYNLPPVPTNTSTLTGLQAAQFGAGQTIYVVDAMHDPYAFGELGAFSQLFGLPACTLKKLAPGATLPLQAPTANACDFYQIYGTTSGTVTATAPAYDANWAIEIALDVQWAHAIAPLARIVLIEAPAATSAGIGGAIQLANLMGPGVVSMSLTGPEGGFVGATDAWFRSPGMSYFAATGDSGSGVGWPSVSPYVVAVGGTSLTYSGSSTRSETAWSLTGGGVSAYVATPAWQNSSIPGLGTPAHRTVADVAFNADPNTGQFVAVIPNPLTCTFCQVSWVTAGGTSLATPQWAALAAVANALRVQSGKPLLGDPHAILYGQIAAVAGNYSVELGDVVQGSDGTCAVCSARKGYDAPTGLGTPNGLALINALAGASIPAAPPVVTGATINGSYTQSLSFTASVSDANSYTLSLSGAPSGMTISSNAVVSWGVPVPGTYKVTVIARDSKTGLSGQGVYTVVIAPPPPPLVSSGSLSATAGQALSFNVPVGDVNPCSFTLSGAPSGMTISATGGVSWPKPVTGAYTVIITARDSKTGLSAQGVYTVAVSVPLAPAVSSGSISARLGAALTFNVTVVGNNPVTFSLSGAPSGMSISASGAVSWANPVAGTYSVSVLARDSKSGLSGQGMYRVVVGSSSGPAVATTVMTGVAGKPFTGTITITDGGASIAGVGLFGAPNGMSFSPQGGGMNSFAANWPNPVAGSYTVQVSATDSTGAQAMANIPLTITSH